MKTKIKKTLFFINGACPSEDQLKIAKECGGKVCFRNVMFHNEDACLEEFDNLLGEIPAKYKKAAKLETLKIVENKPENKELEKKIMPWSPN